MEFEELRAQMRMVRERFGASVRDTFGQSIQENVFDVCDEGYGRLQEAFEKADAEKRLIEAMLMELRLIVI